MVKNFFSQHRLSISVLGGFAVLLLSITLANAILGIGPNLLMKWLGASENVQVYFGKTLTYGLRLLAYIVFPALALKTVLRVNPWPGFFPLEPSARKDVLTGILVISAVLSALFVLELASSGLILDGWNWQVLPAETWWRILWTGFLVNLCVAVGEETLFRGYLLTGLNAVWGRWRALLGMSVVFGVMHLLAYSEGGMQSGTLALAILLATLFGLLFGLVRMQTGTLWMPVALHFTWNFLETDVFNLTGDGRHVNLVGAITRLQPPLTMIDLNIGNIIILEFGAFVIIAGLLWLLALKGLIHSCWYGQLKQNNAFQRRFDRPHDEIDDNGLLRKPPDL